MPFDLATERLIDGKPLIAPLGDDGWLYLVYGGGDSYILAARLRFADLVGQLEARERGGPK